jgi:hypothetical protein
VLVSGGMRGRVDCVALSSRLGIRELGWRVLDSIYLSTYTVFAYTIFL